MTRYKPRSFQFDADGSQDFVNVEIPGGAEFNMTWAVFHDMFVEVEEDDNEQDERSVMFVPSALFALVKLISLNPRACAETLAQPDPWAVTKVVKGDD